MEPLYVRAEYLHGAHYFYFFVSATSLVFGLLSFEVPIIAGFLIASGILNCAISWVASKAVGKYYAGDDESRTTNYVILLLIALAIIFVPLYVRLIQFDVMQQGVIIMSYFFFFFASGNYLLTRISVVSDLFRIVHLTKYHVGLSKVVDIFANPEYESLVDILNLIEPRLIEYYEPSSSKKVDELLLKIADAGSVHELRTLLIEMGIALYEYELSVFEGEKGDGKPDNSALIRRFGYKKRLLEIAKV